MAGNLLSAVIDINMLTFDHTWNLDRFIDGSWDCAYRAIITRTAIRNADDRSSRKSARPECAGRCFRMTAAQFSQPCDFSYRKKHSQTDLGYPVLIGSADGMLSMLHTSIARDDTRSDHALDAMSIRKRLVYCRKSLLHENLDREEPLNMLT